MKTRLLVFLMCVGCCLPVWGRQLLYGDCYLSDGSVVEAHDSVRFEMPAKKGALKVFGNAYTASQKIREKIPGADVDSLVLWSATAAQRPHTLEYIAGKGWCWQLERTPYIAVYCFGSKGYYINGPGGMGYIGKGIILVVKDGIIVRFDKPDKYSDLKFRRKVAALVPDDPGLVASILAANGRRDKILRMLRFYTPKQ